MADFYERMERVDQEIHEAIINKSYDSAIGHMLAAISILRDVATEQHEQIVDLNSRVEYGYTRKEVLHGSGRR